MIELIGIHPAFRDSTPGRVFGSRGQRREAPPVRREHRDGQTIASQFDHYGNGWSITTPDGPAPLPAAIAERFAKFRATCNRLELADSRRELKALERELERRKSIPPLFARELTYSERRRRSQNTVAIYDHVRQQPAEYRGAIACLYVSWRMANLNYFHNKLKWPRITVGTREMANTSLARCHWNKTPTELEFSPGSLANMRGNDLRGPWGLVLHEAIHQYQSESKTKKTAMDNQTGGHGEFFTKVCNRIGGQLGLRAVVEGTPCGKPLSPTRWPLDTPKLGAS